MMYITYNKKYMNRKCGFTLIELLVVMALLAILMALGAGTFSASLKRNRDATRKANLRAITNALEMYYNDKGKFPLSASGGILGCGTDTLRTLCPAANGAFQDETPSTPTIYMSKLPTDPVSAQQYYYVSDGTKFQIYARLEYSQDSQIDPTITAKGYNCATSGTIVCNFGLSSGNINP